MYPYDVIKSIDSGDSAVAKAQWEALPISLGDELILAVVDVSGSMEARVGTGNVTNMQIATSLGLTLLTKQRERLRTCS